jgi:hypothetical protein
MWRAEVGLCFSMLLLPLWLHCFLMWIVGDLDYRFLMFSVVCSGFGLWKSIIVDNVRLVILVGIVRYVK